MLRALKGHSKGTHGVLKGYELGTHGTQAVVRCTLGYSRGYTRARALMSALSGTRCAYLRTRTSSRAHAHALSLSLSIVGYMNAYLMRRCYCTKTYVLHVSRQESVCVRVRVRVRACVCVNVCARAHGSVQAPTSASLGACVCGSVYGGVWVSQVCP